MTNPPASATGHSRRPSSQAFTSVASFQPSNQSTRSLQTDSLAYSSRTSHRSLGAAQPGRDDPNESARLEGLSFLSDLAESGIASPLNGSTRSIFDPLVTAPLPANAMRAPTYVLQRGELTDVKVGDIISFGYPDATGRIPDNSPNQFVVDTVPDPSNAPHTQILCLRDATKIERNMHDLLIEIGSLSDRTFSCTLGKQALYEAFVGGIATKEGAKHNAQMALVTSPRHGAIRHALHNIAREQCTFNRVNAGVPDMIVSKSRERPTVIEKGVFREDIGILAKKGDKADLQLGDTISVRRLIDFKLEGLNNNYWLSCTDAADQCKSLKGRAYHLGPANAPWTVKLGRAFFETKLPLISSEQGIIEHNPRNGLTLSLPKDQRTLWLGIKRPQTGAEC